VNAGDTVLVAIVNPTVNDGHQNGVPGSLGDEREGILVTADPGGHLSGPAGGLPPAGRRACAGPSAHLSLRGAYGRGGDVSPGRAASGRWHRSPIPRGASCTTAMQLPRQLAVQ
jgi:hypothetical protein